MMSRCPSHLGAGMFRKSPHFHNRNHIVSTRRFLTLVLWSVVLVLLPACGTVSTMMSSSSGEAGINLVGPSTPQQVAEQFLTAWNAGDTEAMYALISARSQGLYAFETFDRVYTSLSNEIGQRGVSFTLNPATLQGESASLSYDVTVDSELFGPIEDTERTLRLVREGDQWRVAWSTMDIFDGYTADASLSVETVPQRRANIYDRDGDVLVEERGIVSVLYVQQNLMNTVPDCQRLLADLLYEPLSELQEEWSGFLPETIFYAGEIDEQVEIEYRDRLRDTCGITRDNGLIDTRVTRQYTGQGAIVHVTGYIGPIPQEPEAEKNRWLARGYSEGDLIGRAGIELQYEPQLAGRPPRVLRITAPNGTVLRELGNTDGTPAQPVYLTIDDELQIETARAVAWGFNYASNSWAEPGRSPGGGAVVMDVNTGAILAMASFPTFSPTLFNPDSPAPNRGQRLGDIVNDPRSPLTNRVTQEQYSPGSVYKIISTAAVLNEGLIRRDRIFDCGLTWDGSETYGDTFSPRSDWRLTDGLEATGEIVPSQALTSSCDPFYYEFGARMFREVGPDVLVRYTNMFGINGPTGIAVYPEAAGNIPRPASVEEAINNAIGQGNTQTTVLQNAVMVSAVANGGTVYQPYIVQQVGTSNNIQVQGEPTVVGTLDLEDWVLEEVQRGMCDVIADDVKGTAFWIFNDNTTNAPYVACGKTGTAQAGYAPHAWFVAYAPADDPQIAVVAMAQHSREGSEVAAPMVRRIMDAYFDAEPAEFPFFWTEDYVPLEIPDGGTGG
jgi:penicillin-binding protein 2